MGCKYYRQLWAYTDLVRNMLPTLPAVWSTQGPCEHGCKYYRHLWAHTGLVRNMLPTLPAVWSTLGPCERGLQILPAVVGIHGPCAQHVTYTTGSLEYPRAL